MGEVPSSVAMVGTLATGLSGTYPCDAAAQANVVAILTRLNAGMGFPMRENLVPIRDASGDARWFSHQEFRDFAEPYLDFVFQCHVGEPPAQPIQFGPSRCRSLSNETPELWVEPTPAIRPEGH